MVIGYNIFFAYGDMPESLLLICENENCTDERKNARVNSIIQGVRTSYTKFTRKILVVMQEIQSMT